MVLGFGQKRLLYKRWAGLMHVTIFFGFLVVFTRTCTLIGRGFDADFHLPLLGGGLGLVYAAIKDTFAVLVLLAVLYAIWRRLVVKPSRLHLSFEAVLVLLWIAALMVTDFLADAAPVHPAARPCRKGLGLGLDLLAGVVRRPARSAWSTCWWQAMFWVHVVLLLAFLNFLPFGKHFHVITALPAVYLRRLTPSAALEKMEFEGREMFGVGTTGGFHLAPLPGHVHLHRVRALRRDVPGQPDGQTPQAAVHHHQRTGPGLRDGDHLVAVGKLKAAGKDRRGRRGHRGDDPAGPDRRRQRRRGHLGLHDLRLVRGCLPGDDRPHPQHHRPAALPDHDGGQGAHRAAGGAEGAGEQQQSLERQRRRS